MELAVISSHQLDEMPCPIGGSKRIATDAPSIHAVGLVQFVTDTSMLGDVAIGQMHIRKCCLGLFVDAPSNDTHLRSVMKPVALPLDFVLLVATMNEIMTRLTQGDEVGRRISTRLARLNMMHIQNLVPRFALAPLTDMIITEEHIFSRIPEAQLWPLLVLDTFNLRVLELLEIKLCHLNRGPADFQQRMCQANNLQMSVNLVLN